MSVNKCVYKGTFVSSSSLENLTINHGFICVEDGLITLTGSTDKFYDLQSLGYFNNFNNVTLLRDHEIMIPGFVDCHTHAPQFPNLGVGLDRPLLEWLDKYTFPLEKKYSDVQFAFKVYNKVVENLLRNGTTAACYFGSLHLEGTMELTKAVIKHHQRALVGKVSMNKENEAGYYNNTNKELNDTEEFVKRILHMNSLVEPIITPRFAVSCDEGLMTELASIAERHNCRIQSHISENIQEIKHVLAENPSCKSYSAVYDKCGILNSRCIMAHAVHLASEEMELLASRGVSVAHCPASNTRLRSGLCPVRDLLDHHIVVGLGTDVSGGDSASMLDAMRRAMDVSTHLDFVRGSERALDWRAVFYLATMGGAKALKLDDKIGDFQAGKEFDALRIDVDAPGSPIVDYKYSVCSSDDEVALSTLQRFIHSGDNRNIREVYVKGIKVLESN